MADDAVTISRAEFEWLASYVADNASSRDRQEKAKSLLLQRLGRCEAAWHDCECQYHSGHPGAHRYISANQKSGAWWE